MNIKKIYVGFQLLDKLPKVSRICHSNVFHILYEVKKIMWFT